mmetsp:Transcript_39808/g.124393  ORF Transcript_39808/g.124393 Transcript_39808/m.124393 type:complete len:505 (+) Transcript_39808:216-1730(+)
MCASTSRCVRRTTPASPCPSLGVEEGLGDVQVRRELGELFLEDTRDLAPRLRVLVLVRVDAHGVLVAVAEHRTAQAADAGRRRVRDEALDLHAGELARLARAGHVRHDEGHLLHEKVRERHRDEAGHQREEILGAKPQQGRLADGVVLHGLARVVELLHRIHHVRRARGAPEGQDDREVREAAVRRPAAPEAQGHAPVEALLALADALHVLRERGAEHAEHDVVDGDVAAAGRAALVPAHRQRVLHLPHGAEAQRPRERRGLGGGGLGRVALEGVLARGEDAEALDRERRAGHEDGEDEVDEPGEQHSEPAGPREQRRGGATGPRAGPGLGVYLGYGLRRRRPGLGFAAVAALHEAEQRPHAALAVGDGVVDVGEDGALARGERDDVLVPARLLREAHGLRHAVAGDLLERIVRHAAAVREAHERAVVAHAHGLAHPARRARVAVRDEGEPWVLHQQLLEAALQSLARRRRLAHEERRDEHGVRGHCVVHEREEGVHAAEGHPR